MLVKYFLAAVALVFAVESANASEAANCKAAVTELAQQREQRVSCVDATEPAHVVGVKALYGNANQADLLLMRINDRGAPVSTVVAIIVFLPAATILFFSWLVKSSK